MDNSEVQMKEYETLRQEILDHQGRREQLFLFTITAFGIVWGFILRELLKDTESGIAFIIISFAPYFVILNFCLGNAIGSKHIISIGTYIRHFIESNHKEALHWETTWNEFAKGGEMRRGYWYQFCFYASIGTLVGVMFFTFLTDKLEPLGFQPIYNILANTSKLNLKLPARSIVFAVAHIATCVVLIMKGVSEIHIGDLNRRAREYWDDRWTNYNNQIEMPSDK